MKIYLIGLYADKQDFSNVRSILGAKVSYLAAKQYALNEVDRIKKDPHKKDVYVHYYEGQNEWYVTYKYDVKEDDIIYNKEYEWIIRIEETELDGENTPVQMIPEIEKRNNILTKENMQLRDQNSELEGRISKARPYLAFYGGGIYETFDHLLDNIHKAREILRGDNK